MEVIDNLDDGFGQVKRLCAVLELPRSVQDRAAVIFRKAQSDRLLQGRSIDGMAATTVYAACRELTVLRTAAEVAAANGTDERRVHNDYSVLNAELSLTTLQYSPERFVSRLRAELQLRSSVRERAVELIQSQSRKIATGSPRSTVAAAAFFFAAREAGLVLTQKGPAAACGTTDTTIRSQARALYGLVISNDRSRRKAP